MDINLPLILFVAVSGSGVIWLFDMIFLAKPRREALVTVEQEFSELSEQEKETNDKYQAKKQLAEEEPVIVEYAKSFFPVLFLVFFLRSFLVEPFQIPSESMVPTLEVGDFILVNKYAYGVRLPLIRTKVIDISEPKRGDVMVFFPPKEERYFIKRVVGLPGDQIKIADNQLFINGVKQEQTLIDSSTPKPGEPCAMEGGTAIVVDETFGDKSHKMRKCVIYGRPLATRSWTVPQGHYFMMGDNRDNSADSRSWGTVPEERIVGKAFAIWMHWEKLLSIPSFSRVGTI